MISINIQTRVDISPKQRLPEDDKTEYTEYSTVQKCKLHRKAGDFRDVGRFTLISSHY